MIYKHMGFECITNMDFSSVLIDKMNKFMATEGNEVFDKMEYIHLDICHLENAQIEPDSYDVIIDKGCLDCVACNEDP